MRLVKGKGSPERGACWMSAVSHYAGERWSDHPECVCMTIRPLAIMANDMLPSDEERERIIGPHLWAPVGTRTEDPEVLRARTVEIVRFAARCARRVVHLSDGPDALRAIEAAEAWADCPSERRAAADMAATRAAWAARAAGAAGMAADMAATRAAWAARAAGAAGMAADGAAAGAAGMAATRAAWAARAAGVAGMAADMAATRAAWAARAAGAAGMAADGAAWAAGMAAGVAGARGIAIDAVGTVVRMSLIGTRREIPQVGRLEELPAYRSTATS